MQFISLDLTGFMETGIGPSGICESDLDAMSEQAQSSYQDMLVRRQSGEIGFWDLPDEQRLVQRVLEYANSVPPNIDTVVILGIGGSSLGARALYTALSIPFDGVWPGRDRVQGAGRRLFFCDNSDPKSIQELLQVISLENTLFNVVTKSGATAETVAQLLVVADEIERNLGAHALPKHIVVTTDPVKGALRRLATEYQLPSFPVPSNVGGRFSVLSAVGLLPAALAGLDVRALLEGAASIRDDTVGINSSPDIRENAALFLASTLTIHDRGKNRPMVVLMPYADSLFHCADWFRQLWAESLGKATTRDGENLNVGATPIASRGATDQHSQLQLYAEGPDDKSYLFVTLADRDSTLEIPYGPFSEAPEFRYLCGHSVGELIDAELQGTRASLSRRKRPNACMTLERLDAHCIGAFIMFFEAVTAFAGSLYGVDAFDQPGVEEAKMLAFAALGRPGYEEKLLELLIEEKSDPRYCY